MHARAKRWISNLSCGALTAAVASIVGGPILGGYAWIAQALHGAPPATTSPWVVLAAILALDLLYYLQHRAEHRVGWLWRIHEVHHQADVCDLSVSFRTSALSPVLILGSHLPLAVLGVPLEAYLLAYALHTAFVFVLHSRTPAWLDRAGWVFNSPLLHRGHHAQSARLRNSNFGGVLVIWDRLLGTFDADCAGPLRFGLPGKPPPFDPLTANLAPWRGGR